MKYSISSYQQLPALAGKILRDFSDTSIFTLTGNLGAGKTSLIQAFCKHIGIQETVNSPSFALVNEYLGKDNIIVYHFDFYRIEDISELHRIGFDDYLYSGDYIFIEWPEIGQSLITEPHVHIQIQADDAGIRHLEVSEAEPH